VVVARALDRRRLQQQVKVLRAGQPTGFEEIIGQCEPLKRVLDMAQRAAPTDLTILIQGESGTGKEVLAQAIHRLSLRKDGPLIPVNAAAIPEGLLESELFGHERGAFTGAIRARPGRFELAHGGTLFLDEIGDMPLSMQVKILRALQERQIERVGGVKSIAVDVRIVAATHRDLRQLVRQGLFREDLFYRLNVVPIRLPPLRERSEDIPELVRHFLAVTSGEGLPAKALDAPAIDRLRGYRWPGNVRELENLIRRLAALYAQETIGVDVIEQELAEAAVPPRPAEAAPVDDSLGGAVERQLRGYFAAHQDGLPAAGLYDRVLREVERPLLSLSLAATRGNQIRAAQLLGLNRNTLRKKIRDLDIQVIRGLK
jgi:two-component system nitrogen regulation response regulator GlnG